MELLNKLNQKGKTIIMVTHERDIAAYAEHRLHMKDGVIDRIETEGYETDEDYQEYLARH
jgi:putative ABC transport system ATP-binding protein